MTFAFGTIFDAGYAVQALALYRSFVATHSDGKFYFAALDETAADLIRGLSLPRSHILPPGKLFHSEVEQQKSWRRLAEICWTLKPIAISAMLDDDVELEWVCYLDSDMAFFGNTVAGIENLLDGYFGLFTPHRFGPEMVHWAETVGIHNAGLAVFRRDARTPVLLRQWLDACLARPDAASRNGETFDQKIFDQLALAEPGIGSLDHIGINLAPWNANNYCVTHDDNRVTVDQLPALLYHFQSLRMNSSRVFTLYAGDWHIPPTLRRYIYRPYLVALRMAMNDIETVSPGYSAPRRPLADNLSGYLEVTLQILRRRRFVYFV